MLTLHHHGNPKATLAVTAEDHSVARIATVPMIPNSVIGSAARQSIVPAREHPPVARRIAALA